MECGVFDPKILEPSVRSFWKRHTIYEKVKARLKGKPRFYFLDGPPYTSGRIHLGHAWNKALKDMFLRYKRMQGIDVWDRAGFDMHGLPTEHAVEKKFKLNGKPDILKMGVDTFVKECETLCLENMKVMIDDFHRMGVWMDFENAYQSIKPSFIESVWFLIKKAHEEGRLYEGERTMHWCASCATSLAKHELEYQTVTDTSVFVKFPVHGKNENEKKNEFFVIWTTTPWTLAFNLGIMVNPEIEYVRAKVDKEVWIVAKALAGPLISGLAGKKLEIMEELPGEKLEGIGYDHPWSKEIKAFAGLKKKHSKVHTIVLSSEYVDTSAGSGLVHMAPGCGPEDYEVGHRNDIPPFNQVNEHGIFEPSMGRFAGLKARTDDKKFIQALEETGHVIEKTPVDHEYAHCQRCHTPIVFRTTTQWFFKVEDIKDRLIQQNEQIKWVPNTAFNAFDSWLKNLRDNSITKQRYWGTPLPVWRCNACKKITVISTLDELKKKSGKSPANPHKPWIDEITIPCTCGKPQHRIPDILDVWVDAGCGSWACLDYPQKDDLFKGLYPPVFILEGKDQIRGWFNLLHVCSNLAFGKPSFKNVYMHAFIQDSSGRKMSKSLGNIITPEDAINDVGADALRYYLIPGTPGDDFSYSADGVRIQSKNLGVLWNLHRFLVDLCQTNGFSLKDLENSALIEQFGDEEKFMVSRMHSSVRCASKAFEDYHLHEVPSAVDSLFLDLSRTYIQLVRDKASSGEEDEKLAVAKVTSEVLLTSLKAFAPVAPFITEAIYQNLRQAMGLKEESIHLCTWPFFNEKLIDADLEENMSIIMGVVGAASFAREKANINTRWPLKTLYIVSKDEKAVEACEILGTIIKRQANVKEIRVQVSFPGITYEVKADAGKIGADFGKLTPKVVAAIMDHAPMDIINHMAKDRKMTVKIDGNDLTIAPEHVIITRVLPTSIKEAPFQQGFVYIDTTMTKELEQEGFSREVMRRVQALRRTAGLQRRDRVVLHIKASAEVQGLLKHWLEALKEKCGVKTLTISDKESTQKVEWDSIEQIKGKDVVLRMGRV